MFLAHTLIQTHQRLVESRIGGVMLCYTPHCRRSRSLIHQYVVEGEGEAVTFEHMSRIATVRIYREQSFAGDTVILISLPWELEEALAVVSCLR